MLNYAITARRIDAHGSVSGAREAVVQLDTSLGGREDALNPVELLLSALAACMIKGVERAAPLLGFDFSGVEVRIQAQRQDSPPQVIAISYELIVDSPETDRRLELLHTNVRKYGTISNTLAASMPLSGLVRRA
ncbi:OsmC family protein [Devosia sp. XJ19-1]|uniref:OsmC family protein n=1 Tax=Devosia ureilytica TaxID=2952754 RepID=A0A9Q4AME4_9HYPH|nr:OsmC family protein [Devosia ureilytica]MCP8883346.1 OsmC family protein [Devosia ureilytica]MCP8886286.1 OsmC family protein [Devosia ureilytica]